MAISVTIPKALSATRFQVIVSSDERIETKMTLSLDGAGVEFSLDGDARALEHPIVVAANGRFRGRISDYGGAIGQTVVVKVASPEASSGNGTVI